MLISIDRGTITCEGESVPLLCIEEQRRMIFQWGTNLVEFMPTSIRGEQLAVHGIRLETSQWRPLGHATPLPERMVSILLRWNVVGDLRLDWEGVTWLLR